MKTIKNPTNIQIAKELCKANPNSKYASLLGYDKETGEIAVKDLSIFTSTPDVANEFISDMANKIIVQRAYDLFRGYEMPFSSFMKEMSRLGDAEELLTAELASSTDYTDDPDDGAQNPFDAPKPTIKLSWVKTEDRRVVGVRLNYEVWAGAFVSETGLSNIAGIILKNLRDSIEEYLRGAIKTDLANPLIVSKTKVITAISGSGDTANAQKAYEDILELSEKAMLAWATRNGVKKLGKKDECLRELKAFALLAKHLDPNAKSENYQISARNPLFFSTMEDPNCVEEFMTTLYFEKLLSRYDSFFENDKQYLNFKNELIG